jgi:ketosteroid isomerase-like protein
MKTKQQTKIVSRLVLNKPLTAVVKISRVLSVIFLFLLIVHVSGACKVKQEGKFAITGPTAENALAAEQQLANALLANDADAVGHMLDDDFALVSADGEFGDDIKAGYLAAIKSGNFSRKTRVVTEPRVRLYGNIALVTFHLATSGMFHGKSFDVQERQTDVFIWRKGAWKAVLSHVTTIKE